VNVTFAHFGDDIASSRYRAIIPQRELAQLGVDKGKDWIVVGKHNWSWDQLKGFERVCFDVCDDHFDGPWREHYYTSCMRADLVTCNSHEMARVIEHRTGKQAEVIPDPYEQPEKPPKIGNGVLWFGHASNLKDVAPYIGQIPGLRLVTNADGFLQWSPDTMDKEFNACGLVIIPTGKNKAKSGNRAIESIRRGRFVVAGPMPSYADLGIYIGDIMDGVEWARTHEKQALERVKSSQEYIRDEYCPRRIAKLWLTALSSSI
jgi:hypothetical protein